MHHLLARNAPQIRHQTTSQVPIDRLQRLQSSHHRGNSFVSGACDDFRGINKPRNQNSSETGFKESAYCSNFLLRVVS